MASCADAKDDVLPAYVMGKCQVQATLKQLANESSPRMHHTRPMAIRSRHGSHIGSEALQPLRVHHLARVLAPLRISAHAVYSELFTTVAQAHPSRTPSVPQLVAKSADTVGLTIARTVRHGQN